MNHRISLVFCALLSAFTLCANSPALASGTGDWSDISAQIPNRENRPVWAVAYRAPRWYMTDGIDFYRGGHVWTTDGNSMNDITAEVRQAGLSRVDDIVSDGATILYLKNLGTRQPNFEMLANTNGVYTYPAGSIIGKFQSNEGLASITGKNGTWAIVTTNGRLFFWNASTNNIEVYLNDVSIYKNDLAYSVRHGSSADGYGYLPVFASPVANGWFIGAKQNNGDVRFWFRNNSGTGGDITSKFPVARFVQNVFSNGSQTLIVGSSWNPSSPDFAQQTDGTIALDVAPTALHTNPNFDWKTAVASFDGNAWQLFSKKQALENSFTVSDQTKDIVLTAAGNGQGTILLGGAVSIDNANGPTLPLTAKLIKVTYTNANQTWPDLSASWTAYPTPNPTSINLGTNTQNQSEQNGVSYWQWIEPSLTQLRRDQLTSFNMGAWSAKGISRIDMMVNGITRRTCDYNGRAYGNQTCAVTLFGGDYSLYASVSMNAKITGGDGTSIWTNTQTVQVTDQYGSSNGYYYNYNNNYNYSYDTSYPGDISTWFTLDPSGSVVNRSANVTVRARAQASRGLERIIVFANGINRRICYMNRSTDQQSCDMTFAGTEWAGSTTVEFKTEAIDLDGRTAWSDSKSVTIQDDSNYAYDPYRYGYTNWNWSAQNNTTFNVSKSPNVNEIDRNGNVVYSTTAYDTDGLRRVELLVNGAVVRTCDAAYSWNNAGPSSANCSTTVYGSSYIGTTLTLTTRATDMYGNMVVSQPLTVYVRTNATNYSYNPSTNTQTSSWVWSVPERTDFAGSERPTFKVGTWDGDGVRRIEIYQNNSRVKTCELNRAYGNQECAATIQPNTNGTTYAYVNARVTDGRGNTSWSTSKSYRFTNVNASWTNAAGSSGRTNFPYSVSRRGTIGVSSNRDGGYKTSDLITISASGSDLDGVRSIDLYLNGERVMTCSGTSCAITKGPFPNRKTVTYAATLTDYTGATVTTGYKTIKISSSP